MKVTIGYEEFVVVQKDEIYHEGKRVNGAIDSDTCEISIESKTSNDKKQHIFIHEVVHGIADLYHLDLTEDEVDLLALGLFNLKRDNPRLGEEMNNL